MLDVLFPLRGESIVDLAIKIHRVLNQGTVSITVKEVDVDTQNILILIEGAYIDFEKVKMAIEEEGGVIHSIDQVVVGDKIVDLPHYFIE